MVYTIAMPQDPILELMGVFPNVMQEAQGVPPPISAKRRSELRRQLCDLLQMLQHGLKAPPSSLTWATNCGITSDIDAPSHA